MLTGRAQLVDSFDTTVRSVLELPRLVYLEIEETHHVGQNVHVVNSLTVFDPTPPRRAFRSTSSCNNLRAEEPVLRRLTFGE
jgi:hypothetical protein